MRGGLARGDPRPWIDPGDVPGNMGLFGVGVPTESDPGSSASLGSRTFRFRP